MKFGAKRHIRLDYGSEGAQTTVRKWTVHKTLAFKMKLNDHFDDINTYYMYVVCNRDQKWYFPFSWTTKSLYSCDPWPDKTDWEGFEPKSKQKIPHTGNPRCFPNMSRTIPNVTIVTSSLVHGSLILRRGGTGSLSLPLSRIVWESGYICTFLYIFFILNALYRVPN